MSKKNKKGSDLQGLSSLITDVTLGITDLVEDMHNRIIHPPFLPSTPIQHLISNIAGITYKNIKWGTRFVGSGLDKALGSLAIVHADKKSSPKRETVRSVLNGVVGDYLEKKENPLAITMQFRYNAETIKLTDKGIKDAYPTINGKILLMVHGSCLNEIQWTQKDHNHGESLAKELNKTPVYLHYNSGLHISTNGKEFNQLLETLISKWPVPVEELIIVAHSMGGLVARSALYYGQQEKKKWVKQLKKIVFLGTPHHGAPLERLGHYIDAILEFIPYTKPFARLGKIRSAGVTDLRYGNLIDEDWEGNDRFEIKGDQRHNIPLPKKIACYSIAAIDGKEEKGSDKFFGDGMVSVKSALGQHKNAAKNLHFNEKNTWVAYENTHMDLLSNPKIYTKIKEWLD